MSLDLSEKIAGEIVLSENPGQVIKKWRKNFGISQRELTKSLEISPSVISDYESGRRKSPGVTVVKRLIEAMIEIDKQRGSDVIKRFEGEEQNEAIPDIREFNEGVAAADFLESIEATLVASKARMKRILWGYTVIDSLRAITSINSSEYHKIYGWTSERALIFLGVRYGRSPMVAIRAHPLKPGLVVFHRPSQVDKLAIRLSEVEGIPLAITEMDYEELSAKIHSFV